MTGERGLFEAVTALPADCGIAGATRQALQALAWFADRGVCDPPQTWLAHWTGVTRRSVVDALATLAANGWIQRDDGKDPNGRVRRTRYVLLTDKLDVTQAPWKDEVDLIRYRRADNGDEPHEICPTRKDLSSRGSCATGDAHYARSSPGDERAYKERARAHARPSLAIHPLFAEYPWSSNELQAKAKDVLDVCGPGLADVASDTNQLGTMLDSLLTVLAGVWTQFDFHTIVLPVVARKTAKPRPKEKALRTFYPLTDNMVLERGALAKRGQAVAIVRSSANARPGAYLNRSTSKKVDQPPALNDRVKTAQALVSRMERGDFVPTDLPNRDRWAFYDSDDERTLACQRALEAERAELARLRDELAQKNG